MNNTNYEAGMKALREYVDGQVWFDGGYPSEIQEVGDYVVCFRKSNGDIKYREIETWHKKSVEFMGLIISKAEDFFLDEGLTDDFVSEIWHELEGDS